MSDAAKPFEAVRKRTLNTFSVPEGSDMFVQEDPPLLVLKILPFTPQINPSDAVRNDMQFRSVVTGEFISSDATVFSISTYFFLQATPVKISAINSFVLIFSEIFTSTEMKLIKSLLAFLQ
jgi:hypothetical protein